MFKDTSDNIKETKDEQKDLSDEIVDKDGADELPDEIVDKDGADELPDEVVDKNDTDELPDEVADKDGADELPDEIVDKDGVDELPDEVMDKNDAGESSDEKERDADIEEDDEPKEKKGGSYRDVKKTSDGETHEVHHMPADSASNLETDDGPAIKMEKEDHRQTASCGNSKEAREYRAAQKELIEQGKFREALQMDIDDIHEKFGDKYDDAIAEMLEYVDKLEAEGKING